MNNICCIFAGSPEIGLPCLPIPDDAFYLCADSGLRLAQSLGITPHMGLGYFDSLDSFPEHLPHITAPVEKDDTDTVFAVKEALKRGFDDFLLIGVVGARFDHTFGNISILLMLDKAGKKGKIIDDYSEMEIVSNETAYIDDSFAYFSLLNITGIARGITIENSKYPLVNAEITSEYQYGISNEVLPGRIASVHIKYGKLLLVKCTVNRTFVI